jgi:hypothetical protein
MHQNRTIQIQEHKRLFGIRTQSSIKAGVCKMLNSLEQQQVRKCQFNEDSDACHSLKSSGCPVPKNIFGIN